MSSGGYRTVELQGLFALYLEGYDPENEQCTLYPLVKRGVVRPLSINDILRNKDATNYVILSPFGTHTIDTLISNIKSKPISAVIIEAPPAKLKEITDMLNSMSLNTYRLPKSIKSVRFLVYRDDKNILFSHNALISVLAYFGMYKECCKLMNVICSCKHNIYPCIYTLIFILLNKDDPVVQRIINECLDQTLKEISLSIYSYDSRTKDKKEVIK